MATGSLSLKAIILVIALSAAARALPTQSIKREISPVSNDDNHTDLKEKQSPSDHSALEQVTTQAPKKIVTYILGHPTKDAIRSPADLLRPDRYEFYTFDDDGKIIKKLMNIEEIQKILASSKDATPTTDTQQSSDFYQVLTVTPDVESIPATKINPHEPLFSIHDVIASVQNVLKAEIRDKMTSPAPTEVVDGFQNVHLIPEGQESPAVTSAQPPKLAALQLEEKTGTNELPSATNIETLEEAEKKDETVSLVTEKAVVTTSATTPSTTTTVQTIATTKATPPTTLQTTPSTTTKESVTKASVTAIHNSSSTTSKPITTASNISTKKRPSVQTTTKKPVATTKKPLVNNKPEIMPSAKPVPTKLATTTNVAMNTTKAAAVTTAKPATKLTEATTQAPLKITKATTIPSTTTTTTTSTTPKIHASTATHVKSAVASSTSSPVPITTSNRPSTLEKQTTVKLSTAAKTQATSSTTQAPLVKSTTPQTMEEILAELKSNNMTESSEEPPIMVEVLRVTSSVSQSTSPISLILAVTTVRPNTDTSSSPSQPSLPSSQVPDLSTFSPTVTTAVTPSSYVPALSSHNLPSEAVASTEKIIPVEIFTITVPDENTTEQNEPTTDFATEEATEVTTTESGTESFTSAPEYHTDSPLSLADAHPGFTSSDESSTDSIFAVENLFFDNITTFANISKSKSNYTAAESALNEVQIPMNEDLAESVSSVLSQIANEISALHLEDSVGTTLRPETLESNDDFSTTTETQIATELPVSWLKNAEDIILIDESSTDLPTTPEISNEVIATEPTTVVNKFKPQNQPRPFSKPTTTDTSSTLLSDNALTTSAPEIEARTEADITLPADNEPTTIATPAPEEITTVSVETVPTTAPYEKKSEPTNRLQVIESNGNLNNSIEIIQEAETGRIPRPTQSPGEVTTRPGSTIITTTPVPQSTNKGNAIEQIATTSKPEITNNSISIESQITESTPVKNATTTNIINATTTTIPITISTTTTTTTTSPASSTTSDVTIQEKPEGLTTFEINPNDEVENITISFLPMVIRTSTQQPEPPKSLLNTTAESNHLLASKIIQEEIIEKSAHKVAIAAIIEEKAAPPKQYVRPQTYVKPQKPVFIKPTKSKPQAAETKPSKPVKPVLLDEDQRPYETPLLSAPAALELDQAPSENLGLEATTLHLEPDVRDFVNLCNELAFSLWSSITHNGLSFVRSVVVSPFAVTSMLAMVFLGARGPTSGQMNDVLKLDDVVTFNPHLVFRNVTESLVIARHPGVATAAFVRELYSDRSKGKLLDFYKERAQQFYDGHVEEINFKAVGESLRRQTNHLVRRQTWGKVRDFLQGSTLILRPPLAAFSANIFQADCSRASTRDRDGEMYFVVLPSNRLRRLVPIPAAVWRDDFLAGYEPNLDATVAAVGSVGGIVSTIFVMPGQQGLIAPGDSLARLEHHLLGSSYRRGHWERLMKSLLRRPGLELQVPRINHKSVVNVTTSLVKMGLRDLFSSERADLTGLNGLSNDLHLSDMVQVNQFSTCGDDTSSTQSHSEFYPATPVQRSADNLFGESIESLFAVSDFEDPAISALPLELRPRQARLPSARLENRAPDPARLRLDRPFLYFVRHNPTGLILHVGRFNPRLMH